MGIGVLDNRLRLEDLLRPDIDYRRPPGGGAALFDLVGDLRGKRILDIGCGLGPYRRAIEERGGIWIGLDLTGGSCRVHGDGYRLPFRDGAFDGVLSAAVLEHLPDLDAAMAEVRRVLRPGGRFFGYVAFLEMLHGMSYFHLSHLGLEVLLLRHGFRPERIYPSHVAWAYHLEQILFTKPVPGLQPLMRSLLRGLAALALAFNRSARALLLILRRRPAAERRREGERYAQLLALRYAVGMNFVAVRAQREELGPAGYRAMIKEG